MKGLSRQVNRIGKYEFVAKTRYLCKVFLKNPK